MNFINGKLFYLLLLLVPAAVVIFVSAGRRRRRMLDTVLGKNSNASEMVNVSYGRRRWRFILLGAEVLALLAAAARPWWGTVPVPYTSAGRDVLVLFDVSKSMLASDVAPSRIKHAKFLLGELVKNSRGDRFGLAAFAGDAFLECPLTSDKTSFMQYVDELSPDSIPLGGTNIERALEVADNAFAAAEGSFRAVVLITDGDELTGNSAKAVELLKKKHIPLLIIGLGDPAVPALIPEKDGTFKRDAAGELVKTRLAEDKLREMALATGGVYVRSTASEDGLNMIEKRLQDLIPAENEQGIRSIPVERFPYFLTAAGVLLLGWFIMSERRISVILFMLGCAPLYGNETDPVTMYNEARTLQQEGKEGAMPLYEKTIASGNSEVQSRSSFNIGVDFHNRGRNLVDKAEKALQAQQLDNAEKELKEAQKELTSSADFYRQSLSFAPEFSGELDYSGNLQKLADDRKKIEDLLKKIEELKKQQQQAQDKTQQARDENKQNQQNQQQNQQKMNDAKKSAEDLAKKAEELQQKDLSQKAKEAAKDIDKAAQAAKENRKDEADKHLEEAQKKLGGGKPDSKEDDKKQEQKGDKGDKKESRDDKNGDKNPEKPQNEKPQSGGKPEPKEGKLDKESAEKLLELMAGEEKDLRDALKANMQRRRIKVEKDW